jgi:hypothetical protein
MVGTNDGGGMSCNPVPKMKTIYLIAVVLGVMKLQSADILKELECHDIVVRHGVETLILPSEVESLFGATNVDHFISGFGSKTHPAVWNSIAYFAGRYRLALQVPISIDYERCSLVGATNSAMIQINEVTKIEFSKSGIAEATMKGQWRLNENEWKWLVKNSGDWSVVKVPIVTNAPVKGFDEYVRQGIEPVRNRQEGFDKPIKQTIEGLRKQQSNPGSESGVVP